MLSFTILHHLRQTRPIQVASLKKRCSTLIYGIFTPFVPLIPTLFIFIHADREQIVTQIFSLALKADFILNSTIKLAFSPTINDNIIQASVLRYQNHMKGVINSLKNICNCCDLFVIYNISIIYNMSHPFI